MEHSTSAPNQRIRGTRYYVACKVEYNYPSVVLTPDVFHFFVKTWYNEYGREAYEQQFWNREQNSLLPPRYSWNSYVCNPLKTPGRLTKIPSEH